MRKISFRRAAFPDENHGPELFNAVRILPTAYSCDSLKIIKGNKLFEGELLVKPRVNPPSAIFKAAKRPITGQSGLPEGSPANL